MKVELIIPVLYSVPTASTASNGDHRLTEQHPGQAGLGLDQPRSPHPGN